MRPKDSETQATEERERFAGQAKDLAAICDKLRPGTGMAIETFLKMAYDEGWQARASEGDGERQRAIEECMAIASECEDDDKTAGAVYMEIKNRLLARTQE